MDKLDFIQKAPTYYALAIAIVLLNEKAPKSPEQIVYEFSAGEPFSSMRSPALRDYAFKMLVRDGGVIEIADDFGPTVYKAIDNFEGWLWTDAADKYPLFKRFKSGVDKEWLVSAIKSIDEKFKELAIDNDDLDPILIEEQWAPIPLDRSSDSLKAAEAALEGAIREIEADNGYAVQAPSEREYVLSNLKGMARFFEQESSIYWAQIKTYALEPLSVACRRFGDGATGLAIAAARSEIINWIKDVAGHLAAALFGP
jgi:hypothetical protein